MTSSVRQPKLGPHSPGRWFQTDQQIYQLRKKEKNQHAATSQLQNTDLVSVDTKWGDFRKLCINECAQPSTKWIDLVKRLGQNYSITIYGWESPKETSSSPTAYLWFCSHRLFCRYTIMKESPAWEAVISKLLDTLPAGICKSSQFKSAILFPWCWLLVPLRAEIRKTVDIGFPLS